MLLKPAVEAAPSLEEALKALFKQLLVPCKYFYAAL